MSSRERILKSLREVETEKSERPFLGLPASLAPVLEDFVQMATASGMQVQVSEEMDLQEHLLNLEQQGKNIQTELEEFNTEYPVKFRQEDPFQQEQLPDVFLFKAHFGVAENAAMWLDDTVLPARILAFIPEELILVLDRNRIVATMHEAYEIVEKRRYDYGLFMAGPSKTADIEQTLVTGAQGARKVTIFLV